MIRCDIQLTMTDADHAVMHFMAMHDMSAEAWDEMTSGDIIDYATMLDHTRRRVRGFTPQDRLTLDTIRAE
jgi:hypothetical protein